jgi:hypothetical protein
MDVSLQLPVLHFIRSRRQIVARHFAKKFDIARRGQTWGSPNTHTSERSGKFLGYWQPSPGERL